MTWHGRAKIFASGPNGRVLAAQCAACQRVALWVAEYSALVTGHEQLVRSQMVYPLLSATEIPTQSMPASVRALYDEAAGVRAASPRAAAALLRLALEVLCNEVGAQGASLNQKIGWLVAHRGMSDTVRKAMDVLRIIGNNAVHPGVIAVDEDASLVPSMFRMLNVVVEQLIEAPRHVSELWELLPEDARAAAERRDRQARGER